MSWPYRPDLDGARCIAVYLVLLFHSGISAFGGGFIGVDLFFALSGFLVSNVILSEIDATGRLSFSRFYARRVRRLLPAAVLVVVATSLVFLLVAPLVRRLPLVLDAQSALLYAANWNFIVQMNDYFAAGVDESPFLHFWSLAIEEQFYVVFPVLLVLLVKASRRRSWVTPTVVSGLMLVSLGAQLYWARTDVSRAYYGTDARLYQLLAGVLLAVVLRGLLRRRERIMPPWLGQVTALAGLAGLMVLGSGLVAMTPSWRGVGATAASLALLAGLMTSEERGLRRLLSRGTPVYLGKISYGTYLWHWPVILVLGELFAVSPVTTAVLAAVLSTGLAALSFEVLELPVRTASALRRFDWPAVVAGVATSAVVAATVVPAVLESERRPRLVQTMAVGAASTVSASGAMNGSGAASGTTGMGGSGSVAAGGPAPSTGVVASQPSTAERRARIPDDIDWRTILEDKGPRSGCSVAEPEKCVVVKGDGPHIALVGDSHARVLGPMFMRLARQHDLTLTINVLPACPWRAGVVNVKQPIARQEECRELREEWYAKALPKLDPDLVVLSESGRDDPEKWQGSLRRDGGSGQESLAQLNLATTLETVGTITSQGARVLIVDNLLGTGGFDPLECLSIATTLDQCQVPVPAQSPVSDAYFRIAADRFDGVFTVDLNGIMCVGSPQCLPVVDGIVVWKNQNHYTTMIATHQRAKVWRAISATGALDGL